MRGWRARNDQSILDRFLTTLDRSVPQKNSWNHSRTSQEIAQTSPAAFHVVLAVSSSTFDEQELSALNSLDGRGRRDNSELVS